jgi:hypothetical protein
MPITRADVAVLRANDPRTPRNGSTDADGSTPEQLDWLAGTPMDPAATVAEPLPSLAGFPFGHAGSGAVIVGPTGGGRSALIEACLYDAARGGLRCAYLGCEVTEPEFNARAAVLARSRGDNVNDELRDSLAHVRYLNLASVIVQAWQDPAIWAEGIVARYDVAAIDPLSAVASALDLNFDQSNSEFVTFYDRLVQPLTTRGVSVVMVDNIGHAEDAKSRAKGASAKSDRADLTFSCSSSASPVGLIVKAQKVRSVRAGHQRGDEWLFLKDTQRIERRGEDGRATFRPTAIMERVSKALEDDEGLSGNAIRTTIGGRAEYVNLALELLITEGYIEVRKDGQAHRHYSIKPYREDADSANRVHRDQPWPNRVPDTGADTVSNRVPNPVGIGHGTGHGSDSAGNTNRVPDQQAVGDRLRLIAAMSDEDAQERAYQELERDTGTPA